MLDRRVIFASCPSSVSIISGGQRFLHAVLNICSRVSIYERINSAPFLVW